MIPEKNPSPGFGGDSPDFMDRSRGGDKPEFKDLVTGKCGGRTSPDQITFYRNVGNQGLQRVTWNGKTPFEVKSMNLTETGFRFTFTEPVDKAAAERRKPGPSPATTTTTTGPTVRREWMRHPSPSTRSRSQRTGGRLT